MKGNSGFMLLEVIVALSIVFTLIAAVLPIHVLIERELTVLKERRIVALKLHDALQTKLFTTMEEEAMMKITLPNRTVTVYFVNENDFLKGCATWTNVQGRNETFCLYGKDEK